METILSRHKNVVVLASVLLIQFFLLAVQIKKPTEHGPARLIRIWTIRAITPFEKGIVLSGNWMGETWREYVNVRSMKAENQRLEDENIRLRMAQVRMVQDASQAQRLQALLKFKQQFITETVAAQVIGTSGTEQSRLLYIDKGSDDGIRGDMAVVTPDGVVGKIVRAFPGTAQVLEINDQTSGIGAILDKSRLQGILKGTPSGAAMLHYIMSDEKVDVGENVLTSGGDRIFPKGLPVGKVISVDPGADMFLNIRVKPAARLDRVEEVLVITKIQDQQPELTPDGPQRAADILAARLPSVPVKPPDATTAQPGDANAQPAQQATGQQSTPAAVPNSGSQPKPASSVKQPAAGAKPTSSVAKPQGGAAPKPAQAKPASSAGVSPQAVTVQKTTRVTDLPGANGTKPKSAPKPPVTTTPQQGQQQQ
jgi:rod shape-determining protein MreC